MTTAKPTSWSHLPFSMCSLGSIASRSAASTQHLWAGWRSWLCSWLCLALGWWQVWELQCPKARVIAWRLMKWPVTCLKHHVPRQIFGMRRGMCPGVQAAAIAGHHVRTPQILATTTILLPALATTWQPTKWAAMLRKHHVGRPMFGMRLASCLAGPAAAIASSPVRMCQIPATTMMSQMRRLHLPPPHPNLHGVVMMCPRTAATVICRRQSVQGLGPEPARIVWGMRSRHQPLDPAARCWSWRLCWFGCSSRWKPARAVTMWRPTGATARWMRPPAINGKALGRMDVTPVMPAPIHIIHSVRSNIPGDVSTQWPTAVNARCRNELVILLWTRVGRMSAGPVAMDLHGVAMCLEMVLNRDATVASMKVLASWTFRMLPGPTSASNVRKTQRTEAKPAWI